MQKQTTLDVLEIFLKCYQSSSKKAHFLQNLESNSDTIINSWNIRGLK